MSVLTNVIVEGSAHSTLFSNSKHVICVLYKLHNGYSAVRMCVSAVCGRICIFDAVPSYSGNTLNNSILVCKETVVYTKFSVDGKH